MADKSNIIIKYATESDSQTLARVHFLSFPDTSFLFSVFPTANSETIQKFMEIIVNRYISDSESHVLAGIDPATNKTIAYGRWTIPKEYGYEHEIPKFSANALEKMAHPLAYAPQPMNKEVHKAVVGLMEEKRKAHTKEGDIVLEILCVLPEHQGKGIGKKFLKWGIDKADAKNARIFLEASAEGYQLYLKYGWKTVEEVEMDFAKYGGKGGQKFILMVREPRGEL